MVDIQTLSLEEICLLLETEGEHIQPLLQAMDEDHRKGVQKAAAVYRKRRDKRRKEEARLKGMLCYEEKLYAKGYRYIAGIDEAGRGPVAGPVTVAAVILPIRPLIYGLNDSKKVSPKKREELFDTIINEAIAVSCINFSEEDIDRYDIYHATQQAMYTAVKTLDISPQAVLIDAMPLPDLEIYHESIVGGGRLDYSQGYARSHYGRI